MVVAEVESTGTATSIDIKQTAQVKAGDEITAVGINHESLYYLAVPGSAAYQSSDAATVVDKVTKADGNIRLQLQRPLEQVQSQLLLSTHCMLKSFIEGKR